MSTARVVDVGQDFTTYGPHVSHWDGDGARVVVLGYGAALRQLADLDSMWVALPCHARKVGVLS